MSLSHLAASSLICCMALAPWLTSPRGSSVSGSSRGRPRREVPGAGNDLGGLTVCEKKEIVELGLGMSDIVDAVYKGKLRVRRYFFATQNQS